MRRWLIRGGCVTAAVLLAGAALVDPAHFEELAVGGGAGDADGGTDIDAEGNITTTGAISGDSITVGSFSTEDLLIGVSGGGGNVVSITAPTLTQNRSATLPDVDGEMTLLGQTIGASEIENDAVALGTKTTGNYVLRVQTGTGLTGGSSGSEGADLTLSLSHLGLQSLVDPNAFRLLGWNDTDNAAKWFAPGVGVTFSSSANVNLFYYPASGDISFSANQGGFSQSGLVFEGATADNVETYILITDPTGSDKVITFPNASGEVTLLGQTVELSEMGQSSATTNQAPVWNGSAWVATSLGDAQVSDTLTASKFVGSGSTTDAVDLATAEVAGTLPASSVGTGLTDAQVNDDLTISSSGSVDDGALSANVSLLGQDIDLTTEVTGTLPLTRINQGSAADNQVLTWDDGTGSWIPQNQLGGGNVVGPAVASDNALARFDGTSGTLLQNSNAILGDTGALTLLDILTIGDGSDGDLIRIAGNNANNRVTQYYTGAVSSANLRGYAGLNSTTESSTWTGSNFVVTLFDNGGDNGYNALLIPRDPAQPAQVNKALDVDGVIYSGSSNTQVTDSAGLVRDAALSANVPLKNASNDFTADQTISGGAGSGTRQLNVSRGGTTASDVAVLDLETSGSVRWRWRLDGTESGSNAGGRLLLQAFTDAGAYIDDVLNFTRASGGGATFGRNLTAPRFTSTGDYYSTVATQMSFYHQPSTGPAAMRFSPLPASTGDNAYADFFRSTNTSQANHPYLGIARGNNSATYTHKFTAGSTPKSEFSDNGGVARFTIHGTSGALEWEGSTNDANETVLTVADPTADRTITLPNASGEVSLLGQTIELSELGQSGATTGQVPKWNGSAWAPAADGGGSSAKKQIWLAANEFTPHSVSGAPAPATVAMGTSLRNYKTIQFVDGSETIAYIGFALPDDYDSGSPNVDLRIHWFKPMSINTGNVVWKVNAVATADTENLDSGATSPTSTTITDVQNGSNVMCIALSSNQNAIAGTPTANEHVYLQISRLGADGSDTLTADAHFVGLSLSYTPQ